ncbi:hypothetical protein PHYPSEUDO_008561 [Phytophthora pseudosyringae]|uniref:Helicase-associated domain-containing protein n=1 Tax=Phytophthora pseudosyringae TaxID=221518 RepID=A0A8T1VER9_9STRA|nr:hypothetical protein PHYPSEUDO_008561 [Phytophthora pseudosyringae]
MLRSTARKTWRLSHSTRQRSVLTLRCSSSTLSDGGSASRDSPVPAAVGKDRKPNVWETKVLPALRTYKEKNGHVLVPYAFVVPSDDKTWPSITWGYNLGSSVSRLRNQLKGESHWTISTKVVEELEAIGFAPAASQFKWDTIIMPSLRRFYAVHSHTDVSQTFVVPRGDATWPTVAWGWRLGRTVDHIRHGTVYAPQLEKSEEELESMGFCYKTTIVERDWTEKILPSLEVFRQEFGHCLVSLPFKVPEDPKWPCKAWGLNLGTVVSSMRVQATYTEQAARDKDRLVAIGFTWSRNAGMWNDRIMPALEVFGAIYPHRNVVQKFVVPSEKPWPRSAWTLRLGGTLADMRSRGCYFSFYGRDIEKLDGLNVNLKLSARAWQTHVAPLLAIYLATSLPKDVSEDFVIPSKAPWPEKMWGVRLGLIVARNSHHLPRQV